MHFIMAVSVFTLIDAYSKRVFIAGRVSVCSLSWPDTGMLGAGSVPSCQEAMLIYFPFYI